MVHDAVGLTKRTKKTKLKRPQAFQLLLTTQEELPVKISELRKLNNDLVRTLFELISLFSYVMRHDDTEHERSLRSIPYKQYLRLLGRDWRPKRVR